MASLAATLGALLLQLDALRFTWSCVLRAQHQRRGIATERVLGHCRVGNSSSGIGLIDKL